MNENINDMNSSGKKLPDSLNSHLRAIMPEKELNRFREQLSEEFISDAVEGLSGVNDSKQLESVLQNLNLQMHRQLANKKPPNRRRSIGDLTWNYWAIIFILLVGIIGYVAVRMFLH
ncbi:MAG TPA: hypothetical protein VFE04_04040 [Puia sp.]|nr:hypothetical protein [Puia sp.]